MIWNNNSARQGRKNDFVDAERLVKRLVANELTLSFRQNPLGDGTGGGRLPSEEAGAFHHRGRDGERTDRSQEQQ
jgi:hypothetical protein